MKYSIVKDICMETFLSRPGSTVKQRKFYTASDKSKLKEAEKIIDGFKVRIEQPRVDKSQLQIKMMI